MGKIICGMSNLGSNKVTCAAMKISNFTVTTSICDVNKANKTPILSQLGEKVDTFHYEAISFYLLVFKN